VHWLGAHRLPEALTAAVRAGIEAEELYAFAEASHHFLRALDLWPRVEDAEACAGMDQPALQARAAEAAALGDDSAVAMRLIRKAIEQVDPAADPYRAAILRDRLAHYYWLFAGDEESAQRTYQEAVDLLPPDRPRPELARVLASLAQIHMLRGRTAEALERAEQALAVAREVGAGAAEALALNTLGSTFAFIGDRERAIALLRESLERSRALGETDTMFRAYVNLAEVLDQDGQLEESAALSLEGAQRSGEVGMRDSRLLLLGETATRAFKLGRLADADAHTREALDLQPSLARLVQCGARARVEVQRGNAAAARELIQAAQAALPRTPATWIEPLASARVEHELLCGRPEDARRVGEEVLEPAVEVEYVVFTARLHALTARAGAMLAERARAAGDEAGATEAAQRARGLLERMTRLLDPAGWRVAPPPEALAHHLACVAECARADGTATAADWAVVAERWVALGLPLEEAYARLRETECLTVAGERAAAERACAAGLGIARAAEATWLVEQLEALARRGRLAVAAEEGAEPAPPDDALDRLGLTERERAVLELVAQGLSNREIGEQLFMATKTASVHVSRILAKLEVGSRVEAATAAQRLGIVR
jgi:ATP/maltotriose-dependent transcriptional regulator MalT